MTDRQTTWVKRYQQLLEAFVEHMGGEENISPIQRATACNLATLQTELAVLRDRFANGKSAAEDLNLYLRLTGQVNDLLKSAGLDQPLQSQNSSVDGANVKLGVILANLVRVREEEERSGIFRDSQGAVIEDSQIVEIEKAIFALKQKRD